MTDISLACVYFFLTLGNYLFLGIVFYLNPAELQPLYPWTLQLHELVTQTTDYSQLVTPYLNLPSLVFQKPIRIVTIKIF